MLCPGQLLVLSGGLVLLVLTPSSPRDLVSMLPCMLRRCPVHTRTWECYHCPINPCISSLTISLGSLQDTVLDACLSESPAVTSQPTVLPAISERGLSELELVKQELQALQEELQEVAEARRAAWEAQVSC